MSNSAPVDQFRSAMIGLLPDIEGDESRIGLAVSGGPDSLALLLLSHDAFPDRIAAASVDHGLRESARTECEYVARLCADRDIPHHILKPRTPILGSIQAEARKVRYQLLKNWMADQQIDWLATAHHADDQLETLIMRILRGSGIEGMSAIRARRGNIVRPLLGFAKADLLAILKSHGVDAIDDPTNRDMHFDRVRIREALDGLSGFDVRLAHQSAAALDDARAAIDWMVEKLAGEHISKQPDGCRLDKTDFPPEILRRLLLRCLHYCDPALSPRGKQLDRTIVDLKAAKTVTLGDILCRGGEQWQFSAAPQRRN